MLCEIKQQVESWTGGGKSLGQIVFDCGGGQVGITLVPLGAGDVNRAPSRNAAAFTK